MSVLFQSLNPHHTRSRSFSPSPLPHPPARGASSRYSVPFLSVVPLRVYHCAWLVLGGPLRATMALLDLEWPHTWCVWLLLLPDRLHVAFILLGDEMTPQRAKGPLPVYFPCRIPIRKTVLSFSLKPLSSLGPATSAPAAGCSRTHLRDRAGADTIPQAYDRENSPCRNFAHPLFRFNLKLKQLQTQPQPNPKPMTGRIPLAAIFAHPLSHSRSCLGGLP